MKFIRYGDDRLGLLTTDGTGVVDLTDRLGLTSADPLPEYIDAGHDASDHVDAEPDHDLADVTVRSPIRRPGKIVAWPGNYTAHSEEMGNVDVTHIQAYFLKANTSVIGPGETIEIPYDDRRFDHEIELGFVMAEDVKDVDASEAMDSIFGYTMGLDISMRGDDGLDRSNRKSFDTFTPLGPAVVTPDEIDDPHDLSMQLSVNGELRQDATTSDMVFQCDEIIQYATINATICAGDVVVTGTPDGVGPLADGDEVTASLEGVGEMEFSVVVRDESFDDRVLPPR